MLNDRDDKDKYEDQGPEESEYHFSDEDLHYEIEGEEETPKVEEPATVPETKKNIFSQLTRSRRMLISLAVFLVLVFVVYKMVSPTTTTAPSTEITAAPQGAALQPPQPSIPVAAPQAALPPQPTVPTAAPLAPAPIPPPSAPIPAGVMPVAGAPPVVAPPPEVISPAMQAAQQLAQQERERAQLVPPVQPTAVGVQPQQPAVSPQPVPPQPVPQQPVSPQPIPTPQQPVVPQQLAAPQPAVLQPPTQPPPAQPVVPVTAGQVPQPITGPIGVPAGTPPPVAQLPPVIPVQSAEMNGRVQNIDTKIAHVSAESDRLIREMQVQYTQQLSEFSNQNKTLQDQIQTLSSRVATMESQLNQLVQAIMRRVQAVPEARPPVAPPPVAPITRRETTVSVKIPYNIQAIIPGRAWLRADNGETLTVAEGDVIKGIGRVTEIDPYDGIVEINTGTKKVALSYGNGG